MHGSRRLRFVSRVACGAAILCAVGFATAALGEAGTPASAPRVVQTGTSFRGAATAKGRALALDGSPFFPVMTWAQCAGEVGDNLALGVNVFMGTSPCGLTPEQDLVRKVADAALTVMPIGSESASSGRRSALIPSYHPFPFEPSIVNVLKGSIASPVI